MEEDGAGVGVGEGALEIGGVPEEGAEGKETGGGTCREDGGLEMGEDGEEDGLGEGGGEGEEDGVEAIGQCSRSFWYREDGL